MLAVAFLSSATQAQFEAGVGAGLSLPAPEDDEPDTIHNLGGGQCLTLEIADKNALAVQMEACNGNSIYYRQQWYYDHDTKQIVTPAGNEFRSRSGSSSYPCSYSYAKCISQKQRRCLTVVGSDVQGVYNVKGFDCLDSSHEWMFTQKWSYWPPEQKITLHWSGDGVARCLHQDGQNLQVRTCDGSIAQKFQYNITM